MRTIKNEYKVYTYDELDESTKRKAIQHLYDINIDHEWWDSTYEDAAMVGLKILEFDIERGSYCKLEFTGSPIETAIKILENHGSVCETFKTALEFITKLATIAQDSQDFEDQCDIDSTYNQEIEDFQKSISEDFRILLQQNYEYLTSEEAILETIEANEYEFTKDGKLS